jgi:Flagellar biosynthesis protein, FliO
MREWLEGLAGPQYATMLGWALAALILLAIVLVIVRLVRSLTFGTFVAGGRNRKTRLAVMDATAVDSHRRLVLVRRDDVEHLLLIGGPTDVVVEQDIRLHVQHRRPAQQVDAAQDQVLPRVAERSRPTEVPQPAPHRTAPAQVAPTAQPQRSEPVQPVQAGPSAQPQRAPERPTPQLVRPVAEPERIPNVLASRPTLATYTPPAANAPLQPYPGSRASTPAPAKPPLRDNIDDALMDELQVGNGNGEAKNGEAKKPAKPELSLEDEMTKLLGELSSHKR